MTDANNTLKKEKNNESVLENGNAFDKSRAKKNVAVSVVFKIILLALSLISKRYLINFAGNEYNGLNSLFNSIISFLAVADLGIGSAIIYCMYDPIVKNDIPKIRQLYSLFKRIYFIIGLIVLVLGCVLIPFLPFLANGYDPDPILYVSYLLSLIAVVLTYFYSAKMSLINAYKNNYISTFITSSGLVIQYVLQIVLLYVTKNFILYCVCKIAGSLFQIIVFTLYTRHKDITSVKEKADADTKKKVTKNVKAMFMHKIGDVIFGTVDNLVISSIIGVIVLGYYSNYLLILTSMNEVLKLFIIPLTSVIGHMGVNASPEEKNSYFRFFYGANFILGIVFYLGYFSICSDFVKICFGEGLSIDQNIIIIMTITYFIQFMRQSASVFKDSFGLFYKDRWLAIIASLINVALSIAFAFWLGIIGVLLATIIIDLLLYHVIEPFILYKYAFNKKPVGYYLTNYLLIGLFVAEVFLFCFVRIDIGNSYLHFLVMGLLSLLFNVIPVFVVFLNRDFRRRFLNVFKK